MGNHEIKYGNWEIAYNPPPIPTRSCDWQFCHKDFDGAPDACDNRYGHAPSLIDAMDQIDDMEADAFDCVSCAVSDPSWCTVSDCVHRSDQKSRMKSYAKAKAEA